METRLRMSDSVGVLKGRSRDPRLENSMAWKMAEKAQYAMKGSQSDRLTSDMKESRGGAGLGAKEGRNDALSQYEVAFSMV